MFLCHFDVVALEVSSFCHRDVVDVRAGCQLYLVVLVGPLFIRLCYGGCALLFCSKDLSRIDRRIEQDCGLVRVVESCLHKAVYYCSKAS